MRKPSRLSVNYDYIINLDTEHGSTMLHIIPNIIYLLNNNDSIIMPIYECNMTTSEANKISISYL